MSIDVMKQALEDICGAKLCELNSMSNRREMLRLLDKAITALGAAIYTAPRQWQGLTDEDIENMMDYWSDGARSAYGGAHAANGEYVSIPDIIRDAEAKLREKNHG